MEKNETKLTSHEAGELGEVLNEILDILFNEAATRINDKTGEAAGTKIPYSERIKISLEQRAMKMAQRYNGQAKFEKLISSSNAIVPCLTKLFGETMVLGKIPARAKDERIAALFDKAGANELAVLIRKTLPSAPSAPAI